MAHPYRWLAPALLLHGALAIPASPDAWTLIDRQASDQYRGGDYAGALASAQEALTLAERDSATGPGLARLATSLNTLALIHQAQGRYAEAQPLLERALAISLQALPADHPNIASLRANLQSLQEARQQHELSLDARRAQDLNEQALMHHSRGEYEHAAALYEQALPIVETHFGPASVEAARVLANLADTCEQRKDHSRAEELYRRALDIYEGRTDEAIAKAGVLNALASVHYMQRQYGRAEPLFKRSLQVMETVRGAEHVDLLPVLDNLAALYLTTRRGARAEEVQRRAAAIRKAHGLEAPETHARNR
ncbi:MAG: tetratricopeptide repeat-containing protein [Gammaproteobacteria bacterium]